MSTLVRCDNCKTEVAPYTAFEVRSQRVVAGITPEPDFCSWKCIGEYAEKRVNPSNRFTHE